MVLFRAHRSIDAAVTALLGILVECAFASSTMTKAAPALAHALMKQPTFMTSYLEECADEATRKPQLTDVEKFTVASGND